MSSLWKHTMEDERLDDLIEPETEESTEEVEETTEETTEEKPEAHPGWDKALQKEQQRRAQLERELQEIRARLDKEKTPEKTESDDPIDRILNTSDDDLDPYTAPKTLAQVLKAEREARARELEELRARMQAYDAQTQRRALEEDRRAFVTDPANEHIKDQYDDILAEVGKEYRARVGDARIDQQAAAIVWDTLAQRVVEKRRGTVKSRPRKSTEGTTIASSKARADPGVDTDHELSELDNLIG